MTSNGSVVTDVLYEDLRAIEAEFEDVDTQIIRQQYELSKALFARRAELVQKIPNFWALVLEGAPVELDRYIQPSDSVVFAEALQSIDISRFELETQPRSFSLKFTFSPNKWFEDKTIEKKFWFRRAADNWTGYVSEPVKINWKGNGDLTHGLTDAVCRLWDNSKQLASGTVSIGRAKGTREYEELVKMLENSDITHNSFFTLFAFISGRRWVSAEESKKADADENERRKKRAAGQKVAEPEEEDVSTEDVDTMVCPYGHDIAQLLAEDIYPNAIEYFNTANTPDDDQLSEPDFEMEDVSDEEESDEEVDIRALVGKGRLHKRKEKSSESASPPPTTRVRTEE